jgi:hypothetical protein
VASWGSVVSQTPGTQVLSPTQVLDIMRVGFVTSPTGVYAERMVPVAAWKAGGAADWIAPLATAIEDMISGGLASYAYWGQEVDPATNLLADFVSFVVTYDPGDGRPVQEAIATVPVADLTTDVQFFDVGRFFPGQTGAPSQSPQDVVRATYDRLVATANA